MGSNDTSQGLNYAVIKKGNNFLWQKLRKTSTG